MLDSEEPVVVLGYICTMLDETQSYEIHIPPTAHLMQRRPPTLVLGRRICAVLDDEKAREIHMTPSGCPMQRSRLVIVLGCGAAPC